MNLSGGGDPAPETRSERSTRIDDAVTDAHKLNAELRVQLAAAIAEDRAATLAAAALAAATPALDR
jgi:hypothetical protein